MNKYVSFWINPPVGVIPKHSLYTLHAKWSLHTEDLSITTTETQELLQVVHGISHL